MSADFAVLSFGARRAPRSLAPLRLVQVDHSAAGEAIDETVRDARRVVVLGGDADLAAVLTRLIRTERLDVEVAHLGGSVISGLALGGLARGRLTAHRALRAEARRVPLIRDDTGTAVVGSALWLPPDGASTLHGEAVVDDTVLFDGDVAAVRIEPTTDLPGLRAAVLGGRRPQRLRQWVHGRAAQLGTTGARVVRDGVPGAREVRRSTFYRHTTGWLRVG